MNTNQENNTNLLIKRNLRLAFAISFVIAVIMATASVAGLLYRTTIYPTDELVNAFVTNDVVNLVIGLPILLVSMWLTRRGKLTGLLLWPGALFYTFYNYLVYVFSMPLNVGLLLHLTLVMLSAYALIGLLASIDGKAVKDQLSGRVPERVSGGILTGLAGLFFVRVVVTLITALINQTPVTQTELALHFVDFLLTPAWIIGGVLLWRREASGYVTGLGLLFQASMLFIGLIMVFILQPFLTGVEFALFDVIVVFLMGMVTFIPFALFMRGTSSKRNK